VARCPAILFSSTISADIPAPSQEQRIARRLRRQNADDSAAILKPPNSAVRVSDTGEPRDLSTVVISRGSLETLFLPNAARWEHARVSLLNASFSFERRPERASCPSEELPPQVPLGFAPPPAGPTLLKNSFARNSQKIKLRQDALQTKFSIFLDIFYSPNFRCFEENGVFQHPLAMTLRTPSWTRRFSDTKVATTGVSIVNGRLNLKAYSSDQCF
jgi:hypothetical protein